MKLEQYIFFLFDSTTAVGPFELVGEVNAELTVTGDLQAFTPLELFGAITANLTVSATFDPASFPPRELPDCVGMPRRLDISPTRATPEDGGAMWYERAVERISRREVRLNLALLPTVDREQIAALWDDGKGLTDPFEFTLPETGAVAELYVFLDSTLTLSKRTAVSTTARISILRVSRAGWTP